MKGSVQVLICDGQRDAKGDVFRVAGIQLPDIPVTVALEFKERDFASIMGTAKLRMDGDTIYADLELLDTRMPEPSTQFLYPIPHIVVVERRGEVVHSCTVKAIGLSISRHADKRIGTLAAQGVKL